MVRLGMLFSSVVSTQMLPHTAFTGQVPSLLPLGISSRSFGKPDTWACPRLRICSIVTRQAFILRAPKARGTKSWCIGAVFRADEMPMASYKARWSSASHSLRLCISNDASSSATPSRNASIMANMRPT